MFKQGCLGLPIVILAVLIFAIIQCFTDVDKNPFLVYYSNHISIVSYPIALFTTWQLLLLTLACIVGFGVMITMMFVLIYNGSAFRTVVAASFGLYIGVY